MTEEEKAKLAEKAKKILKGNWEKIDDQAGYTKPSKTIYPFQWNWDSGFIVYGYTHFDLEKAVKECRALFRGQWKNGFLPHIIFHKDSKNYFPDPDFWKTGMGEFGEGLELAPKGIKTSGITQPPIHGMSIWHIYKAIRREKGKVPAIKFLKEFYPKLLALHKYLATKRDPERSGLITIYHPWESGFDNSPRWDEALARITPKNVEPYERVDTKFVDKKFRPTDEDYDRYIYLVQSLRNKDYNDDLIYPDHEFKIKDQVFSSIFYASNKRLKLMANTLGEDTSEITEWMNRFEKNFRSYFYSLDGNFYDYDLVSKQRIKVPSAASLVPLITGLLEDYEISKFRRQIGVHKLVPSVDEESSIYNPDLYWRGPIWVNVNWLLWKGYLEHGLDLNFGSLRENIIKMVQKEGFYEYFSSETLEGRGSDEFSWTAALLLDLIEHKKDY